MPASDVVDLESLNPLGGMATSAAAGEQRNNIIIGTQGNLPLNLGAFLTPVDHSTANGGFGGFFPKEFFSQKFKTSVIDNQANSFNTSFKPLRNLSATTVATMAVVVGIGVFAFKKFKK